MLMSLSKSRGRVLLLWNQVEEDVYERWREEGQKTLEWDPNKEVPDVGTVAEELDEMCAAIREAGYILEVVNVQDSVDKLLGAMRLFRPDVIFNLVEYFNDDAAQEAFIAGLYEIFGEHYTGNRPQALLACQNKFRTKLALAAEGVPTAKFFLAKSTPVPRDHGLRFPVIVKPALEDASGGIEHDSVVHDNEALDARIERVLKEFEMPALVEEYISGREIHCAILGNETPEALPLFEMQFDDSKLYQGDGAAQWRPQIISYRAKWDPHSKDFYAMDAICPAPDLDPITEDLIRGVAIKAYKTMGCRDYARVDMRLDVEEGVPYVLEVNPNPDLVNGAAYMMCASASGRSYSQTLAEIIEMAMERRRREIAASTAPAALPSDALLREYIVKGNEGVGAAAEAAVADEPAAAALAEPVAAPRSAAIKSQSRPAGASGKSAAKNRSGDAPESSVDQEDEVSVARARRASRG